MPSPPELPDEPVDEVPVPEAAVELVELAPFVDEAAGVPLLLVAAVEPAVDEALVVVEVEVEPPFDDGPLVVEIEEPLEAVVDPLVAAPCPPLELREPTPVFEASVPLEDALVVEPLELA